MSQAYRQCMTLSAFDYAWTIVGRKGVWDRETSLCKPVVNGLICIIAQEKTKKGFYLRSTSPAIKRSSVIIHSYAAINIFYVMQANVALPDKSVT